MPDLICHLPRMLFYKYKGKQQQALKILKQVQHDNNGCRNKNEDYAVVTTAYEKRVVPFNSARPYNKKLLKLMSTFVKE